MHKFRIFAACLSVGGYLYAKRSNARERGIVIPRKNTSMLGFYGEWLAI